MNNDYRYNIKIINNYKYIEFLIISGVSKRHNYNFIYFYEIDLMCFNKKKKLHNLNKSNTLKKLLIVKLYSGHYY